MICLIAPPEYIRVSPLSTEQCSMSTGNFKKQRLIHIDSVSRTHRCTEKIKGKLENCTLCSFEAPEWLCRNRFISQKLAENAEIAQK